MSWEYIFAYYGAHGIGPTDVPGRNFIPACDSPDDVKVYTSPWVSNAHSTLSLGPLSIVLEGDYALDEGLDILEKKCRENAFYIGANSIINFSCEIHLWEKPIHFHGTGSCCVLKFQT